MRSPIFCFFCNKKLNLSVLRAFAVTITKILMECKKQYEIGAFTIYSYRPLILYQRMRYR